MAVRKFDRSLLLDCASELLTWIGLQDPSFATRIDITKTEYHLDDLQCISQYVAHVLELGEHMCYSEREFLAPGYSGHLGPRECRVCGQEFSAGLPTDEVCDRQDCREKYASLLDAAFAEKNPKPKESK